MSMEFTLNDLQRRRVEEHLALVEQVLRRSIKTNETVDGMGHDDLYQDGCIALCRAAVSYREEMGAFPAYARTVIRNYLLDRCREIQSARKNLPLLSLDAFAEMGYRQAISKETKLHRSLYLTGGGKAAPGADRAGVLYRLHGTGYQERIRRSSYGRKNTLYGIGTFPLPTRWRGPALSGHSHGSP